MEQRIQDRKTQILDAATEVFGKDGFYNAKVEDIAIAAGVGKGTIYQYYNNKKELFQEMVKDLMNKYGQMIKKATYGIDGCREKLESIIKMHIEFISNYRDIAKVMMNTGEDEKNLHESLMKMAEDISKSVSNIIEEGTRDGELREVDPILTAQVFLGAISDVTAYNIILKDDLEACRDIPEKVLDIIYNGIAKG